MLIGTGSFYLSKGQIKPEGRLTRRRFSKQMKEFVLFALFMANKTNLFFIFWFYLTFRNTKKIQSLTGVFISATGQIEQPIWPIRQKLGILIFFHSLSYHDVLKLKININSKFQQPTKYQKIFSFFIYTVIGYQRNEPKKEVSAI